VVSPGTAHAAVASAAHALHPPKVPRGRRVARHPRPAGAGLGDVALDERLRLFAWATGPERRRYLWVLRVFDRARQAYEVRLTTARIADALAELAADDPLVPEVPDLVNTLDALVDWGVLDRSQEAGRVSSIAEYRRRASVYQLTELGFLAYHAVERVVSARPDDAQLKAIALGSILEDLATLAEANLAGDAVRVHRLLDRLHGVLTDLAERAARFHLAIGELARAEDARPETFVRHKDLLLDHLRHFHAELVRYGPLIGAAVAQVRATGEDRLIELAAEAEPAPFATPQERLARWRDHWDGLVAWFVGSPSSPPRSTGWTPARPPRSPTSPPCSARSPRHAAPGSAVRRSCASSPPGAGRSRPTATRRRCGRSPPGSGPPATSRSPTTTRTPCVPIAAGGTRRRSPSRPPCASTANVPSPGRPAPLPDDRAALELGRRRQLAARAREAEAAARLADDGWIERVLDDGEVRLLLRLLDRALQTRTVTSGRVHAAGSAAGLRLRLRPDPAGCRVRTVHGVLLLPDVALELERAPVGAVGHRVGTDAGQGRAASDGSRPDADADDGGHEVQP
jgi:hypothetical protein